MPLYKQVVLANLKATPKEVAQVFQDCARIITKEGGVVRNVENRGEKRLGYAVEDRRWGALQRHYDAKLVVSQFNAAPAVLQELDAMMKNSFPILRFQTFKIRDPIDRLMNTRQPLESLQQEFQPAQEAEDDFEEDEEDEEEEEVDVLEEVSPQAILETSQREMENAFKNVPEWKRDALYTPQPPSHLKDE